MWILILAYKNPNVANCIFLDNLKNVYENVISKSQEIILLGNLNIDILRLRLRTFILPG